MNAETHLEVYRRFEGQLREHPLRFWPLFTSGLQTALKQQRAVRRLYFPVLIATIALSVLVYLRFAAEQLMDSPGSDLDFNRELAGMVRDQAAQLFAVKNLILQFNKGMGLFAVVCTAWFGGGLICEDRKAGAHQLYFARPLTRLDYFLGKLATVSFFGLLGTAVPALVLCAVAAICSPEWSFVREEWDVPLRALAFSSLWTLTVSSLVLACSSLAKRRNFALLGILGFVFLSAVVGQILGQLVSEHLRGLALVMDLNTLCHAIFGDTATRTEVAVEDAWGAVILLILGSWAVLGLRLRRMEVVA